MSTAVTVPNECGIAGRAIEGMNVCWKMVNAVQEKFIGHLFTNELDRLTATNPVSVDLRISC